MARLFKEKPDRDQALGTERQGRVIFNKEKIRGNFLP
jgi:hypothetical protein